MEAAVIDKEEEVAVEWNDGRLDDLSKKVDDQGKQMNAGFTRIDKKVDDGFARLDKKMDDGFARIDSRLDGLNHVLIQSVWTFGIGLLGFAGALLAVIAEK